MAKLLLESNQIGDEGAEHLANALQNNTVNPPPPRNKRAPGLLLCRAKRNFFSLKLPYPYRAFSQDLHFKGAFYLERAF